MTIKTKYFGEFEVKHDEILTFRKGIFGFEEHQKYTIIPFDEEDEASFLCLQAIDDENLAFILFNPFFLDPDYDPKLSNEDISDLKIGEKTPTTFLTVTVVSEVFQDSTVNMKCPLVVNNDTREAKQVILESDYSMRQRITPPEKKGA